MNKRNKSPLSIISLRWKFCLIKQYRIENCENQRQYSLQKSNKPNFTVKIMLGYSFNSFIWFWNYVFVWMPNCELFCSILIWRNQKKNPQREREIKTNRVNVERTVKINAYQNTQKNESNEFLLIKARLFIQG